MGRWSVRIRILVAVAMALAFDVGARDDNLYSILGIQRSATTKEIKKAYRQKARDTHPDKNTDMPAEEAAEAFRKVAHAFEVLSDATSRRRYDQTGNDSSNNNNGSGQHNRGWQWHFQHGGRAPRVKLKDKFEVKQAQSRLLHVVSLEQLRTIMLDDDDRLERNLLICFFTPALETLVEEEIVYPYPFAGMSPQSIWWEDLLQTVSIRFHRSNELTRYFNIGVTGEEMKEPLFLFAKKGAVLPEESAFEWSQDGTRTADGNFFLHRTSDRQSFESWTWRKMEVKVLFHNLHNHPVELYWIDGRRANLKETIEPGSSSTHYSMLTHEFYARDARVDQWHGSPGRWKLSDNSSLGSWKIGVEGDAPVGEDGTVVININLTECIDISGHCGFWNQQNQCKENPSFMKTTCMLTCGHCVQSQEKECTAEEECRDDENT